MDLFVVILVVSHKCHVIKMGGFKNMKLEDNFWKKKRDKNALVS